MSNKRPVTLIIGLGNPILGDDGVGWRVAEEVQARLNGQAKKTEREIEFDFLSLGGLALMERMDGYSDVIVVDSMVSGQHPIGSIYSLPLDALPNFSAGHTTAVHDTSLKTALEVGRSMGMELPKRIWVVAVEAKYVFDFTEELSPPIRTAVPKAAEILLEIINDNIREEKIYDIP